MSNNMQVQKLELYNFEFPQFALCGHYHFFWLDVNFEKEKK